jgi:ABC-type Fe3+-siderophore transport system permease subunit
MKDFAFWRSAIISIVILILCLIPSKDLPKIDFLTINYPDLYVHFIMFMVFSIFLALDLTKSRFSKLSRNKLLLIAISASILLGAITESLQYLIIVINRTANIGDFLFDCMGSFAGAMLTFIIKR